MPSDEEKAQDGLQRHIEEIPVTPEAPGAGDEVPPEPPAAPGSGADDGDDVEPEPATGAEKKERRFWPLALLLTLFVLGGGGFYALTGLKDTAHKLGGGSEYDQLAANSSVYDGKAGGYRQLDVFAEGESSPAAAGGSETAGRLNTSLVRDKGELAAEARGSSSSSSRWQQGEEDDAGPGENSAAPAQRQSGLMAQKLRAKASLSGGPGAGRSKAGAAGGAGAFEGSGTLVGKGSVKSETKDRAPKKAGKGSVLESLTGAFKASLYGARLSSQDSAKSWISRAFDATEEASTAIEYDEKVKSKLDRVNPNAIPNFLRDQDVTAAEAKRLADSKVSKPKMDREGTEDALDADKDYQKKKMANDFASSMINGLFAGISGTGNEEKPGDQPDQDDDGGWGAMDYGGDTQGYGGYADPEDTQTITDTELQDWVDMNGFGGECGCTADAPCCCLPNSGAGTTDGSMIGDFPDLGGDTMFA